MSVLSLEFVEYSKFIAPPVVGALIGYLTNKVAIKMLFRPLAAWKVGGVRVPMTPGVIPAKRKELARNMGEVVGDHLLTSEAIAKGLEHERFQTHLRTLLNNRVESLMQKDLGPIAEVVPARFQVYLDLGSKVVTYQFKEQINQFISSNHFQAIVGKYLQEKIDGLLASEIEIILPADKREKLYSLLNDNIEKMFASDAMEQWIEDFVHHKVYAVLQEEKTINDLVPESLLALLLSTSEKQIPSFLAKLASIINEPEVVDKVVRGGCEAVDSFIDSMGSMADMVRGFLRMEMVECKIREYLADKSDDIVAWLQSETVHERVKAIWREKSSAFCERPIVSFIKAEDETIVEEFCVQCSSQIWLLLREPEVAATLTSMVKATTEAQLDSGAVSIRKVVGGFVGEKSMQDGREWAIREIVASMRAPETIETINSLIDSLAHSLLQKKIGQLARFVPVGVRDGLADYFQKMASKMLASEVPGLVQSLNISKIVTEKINSLDLMRLERLLLSIMEEQFKYINLFGALLGFLIGCLNLLFVYGG